MPGEPTSNGTTHTAGALQKAFVATKTGKHASTIPQHSSKYALTESEEADLKRWAKDMSDRGFPLAKIQFREAVKTYLDLEGRHGCYKNNMPGKGWWNAFKSRHPDFKLYQDSMEHEAQSQSESYIRQWLARYKALLEKNAVADAVSVFNCMEMRFPTQKSGALQNDTIVHKRQSIRSLRRYQAQISCLICAGANGAVLPPFFIFQGKQAVMSYIQNLPACSVTHVESKGCLTSKTFNHWIREVFLPSLPPKAARGHVVLVVDDHPAHRDYRTNLLCMEERITLCSPPHETSRLLQPLHQGFLKYFESSWQLNYAAVFTKSLCPVGKADFGKIFLQSFTDAVGMNALPNAFKNCGLWPADPNAVTFDHLGRTSSDAHPRSKARSPTARVPSLSHSLGGSPVSRCTLALNAIESTLSADEKAIFHRRYEVGCDTGDGLYMAWLHLKKEAADYQSALASGRQRMVITCQTIKTRKKKRTGKGKTTKRKRSCSSVQ